MDAASLRQFSTVLCYFIAILLPCMQKILQLINIFFFTGGVGRGVKLKDYEGKIDPFQGFCMSQATAVAFSRTYKQCK